MATALKDEKIIGGMGIAAVIVFFVAIMAAAITKSDFNFGTYTLADLTSEAAFVAGCVIAGILGALFGFLTTYKKPESDVFIGKIRGLAMVLTGVVLVIVGLTNGNSLMVYLFIGLVILSAAADMFYNWVVDQKIIMALTLVLTLAIALTGILSQTSDNNIMGFVFILFVSLWMIFLSALRFAPIEDAIPEKSKKEKVDKAGKKKNAPTPRPYPTKKEEIAAKKKAASERAVKKEDLKKTEPPKKEEPVKTQPKKEVPETSEPAKEELPKLKVMSSKQAAMARESARKKEEEGTPEPVKEEPVPEPEVVTGSLEEEAMQVAEEEAVEEPIIVSAPEEEIDDVEGSDEEDFDMMEETPDALLRRATWNKGLRCRRDYGEHQIPIAFVKAKVAVYVVPEMVDTSVDETLRSEGWTVFRYLESDITDGKEQADEISKAVKENLKTERAAKKKKSRK